MCPTTYIIQGCFHTITEKERFTTISAFKEYACKEQYNKLGYHVYYQ